MEAERPAWTAGVQVRRPAVSAPLPVEEMHIQSRSSMAGTAAASQAPEHVV